MSFVAAMFGHVKVEIVDDKMVVSGIKTKWFLKEMEKVTGTVRFSTTVLKNIRSFSFSVPKFFVYDFYHLVKVMYENPYRYIAPVLLESLLEQMKQTEWIQRSLTKQRSRLDYGRLKDFAFEPLPKQREFLEVYDQTTQQYGMKGFMLDSAPGSGKSAGSLMLAWCMKECDTVVVFSPSNALNDVWDKTLREKMAPAPSRWIYGQGKPLDPGQRVYVFSHDNMAVALEWTKKYLKHRKVFFIVDESHNFNEIESARTQMLIELCQLVPQREVLFMSGTIFKAYGSEVIPFLLCTDPSFHTGMISDFKNIFGAKGTRALEVLTSRIGRSSFRVTKEEVVKNQVSYYDVRIKTLDADKYTMPVIRKEMEAFIIERVKYYQLHQSQHYQEYKNLWGYLERNLSKTDCERFQWYKKSVETIHDTQNLRALYELIKEVNRFEKTVLIPKLSGALKERYRDLTSIYKYLPLKIRGEALGRVLGSRRMECIRSIVKHLDQGKIYNKDQGLDGESWDSFDYFEASNSKVVFFTDYVEVLREAESQFKAIRFKPVVVYGDTNKDLSKLLESFEKDPKANPAIATYKSLSTAVPLTMADSVVLLNVPYRDYIYQQTTSRVDRLDQKHPIKIYHLYLDTGEIPNISTRSNEILEWSRDMVERLLGIKVDMDEEDIEEEFLASFSGIDTDFVSKSVKSLLKWV